MAMRVLIVEDEMMAQKSLIRTLTQNFPDMEIVGTSGSVKDTLEWLNTPGNKADVIFMDVELSDGVCFEIFRSRMNCGSSQQNCASHDTHQKMRHFLFHSKNLLFRTFVLYAL